MGGQNGWVVFGDNVIDLLPGEARVVPVEWRGGGQSRAPLTAPGLERRRSQVLHEEATV